MRKGTVRGAGLIAVVAGTWACLLREPAVDPVASAGFAWALDREREGHATEYRVAEIYRVLAAKPASVLCAEWEGERPCRDVAAERLAILACRESPDRDRVMSRPSALAAEIERALAAGDAEALARHASCEFVTGRCHTDAARAEAPEAPIARLLRRFQSFGELRELDVDGAVHYAAQTNPPTWLQLERPPDYTGWLWTGYCDPGRLGTRAPE